MMWRSRGITFCALECGWNGLGSSPGWVIILFCVLVQDILNTECLSPPLSNSMLGLTLDKLVSPFKGEFLAPSFFILQKKKQDKVWFYGPLAWWRLYFYH